MGLDEDLRALERAASTEVDRERLENARFRMGAGPRYIGPSSGAWFRRYVDGEGRSWRRAIAAACDNVSRFVDATGEPSCQAFDESDIEVVIRAFVAERGIFPDMHLGVFRLLDGRHAYVSAYYAMTGDYIDSRVVFASTEADLLRHGIPVWALAELSIGDPGRETLGFRGKMEDR